MDRNEDAATNEGTAQDGGSTDDVRGHFAFLAGLIVGVASVAAGALIGTASDTDTYLRRMQAIYDQNN